MGKPTFEDLQRHKHRPMAAALRIQLLLQGHAGTVWRLLLYLMAILFGTSIWAGFVGDLALKVLPTQTVSGEVRDTWETSISVNERMVSAVYFAYPVGHETWLGTSYGREYWPTKGTPVKVTYVVGHPEISQVTRTTYSKFGLVGQIAVATTGFFLFVMLAQFIKAWRQIGLLVSGQPGAARLTDRENRGEENGEPLLKLTYQFNDDGRLHDFSLTTSDAASLTDEDTELILYKPGQKGRPLLFDELKSPPSFEGGAWECPSAMSVIFSLLKAAVLPAVIFLALFYMDGWMSKLV